MSRVSWAVARHCRTALVWTTLGVFSVVAFFGQGLHLISEPHGECCSHEQDVGCCSHDSAAPACPCESEHSETAPAGHFGSFVAHSLLGHHDCQTCPICTLLATGKAICAKTPQISQPTRISSLPPRGPSCVAAAIQRTLGPRGPPLG